MNDRKTTPNDGSVAAAVAAIQPASRRADAERLAELIATVTGASPQMWGSSIIGYGRQPYQTADGKWREWFAVGFAGRKAALTIYGLTYYDSNADLLQQLGPHTTGKGCLYLTRLSDVDEAILIELIRRAWASNHHPDGDA